MNILRSYSRVCISKGQGKVSLYLMWKYINNSLKLDILPSPSVCVCVCVHRATVIILYLALVFYPFRPHVKWWFLPIPDVWWKCTCVSGLSGHVPRYGSTSSSLLHQLITQHVPDRQTVWGEILCGNVSTGAAVWMQVSPAMLFQS